MKDFYSLFIKELKSIYAAEKQIVKALPDMIKAAHSSDLKEAFQNHLKDTKLQVKRLQDIGLDLNEDFEGPDNEIIKTYIKEARKIIKSKVGPILKDAALINAAQHIEHYEIASYGTLKSFAKHLKATEIFNLLDDACQEEGLADKALTAIAEGNLFHKGINDKACEKCA